MLVFHSISARFGTNQRVYCVRSDATDYRCSSGKTSLTQSRNSRFVVACARSWNRPARVTNLQQEALVTPTNILSRSGGRCTSTTNTQITSSPMTLL
jgi:hypothetical protein